MPPKLVKKALKVEEFLPTDDILETSSKWKARKRKIELQMGYFKIKDPKDKRMCLLVHGGEHILSIDENSPKANNEDADENSSWRKDERSCHDFRGVQNILEDR